MKKYVKYDNTKTYMFPSAALATPEVVNEQYPAVNLFPHIIETDEAEQIIYSFLNIAATRSRLDIAEDLSEDEAIAEISRINNLPNEPVDDEPSAEERIAAAMEFQNLMNL